MDGIELTRDKVVDLERVAPDVSGLRIIFVNVFGVRDFDGSWCLIDAGLHLSHEYIRDWAKREFGAVPPKAILLTHGHFDHIGALQTLLEQWRDVPVYVHERELPFVVGEQKYPPPDPTVGGGIMPFLSPTFPRGPYDFSRHLRTYRADSSIAELQGWRWIDTPGHTPGHVSFFRESDRTLLVGDAFCTTNQQSLFAANIMQTPELTGPPAYFTPDWDQAKASVEKLAALKPKIIAPGHGKPMHDIADALAHLAADFDRIARPKERAA